VVAVNPQKAAKIGAALDREALIRPIGNTLYLMPPYIVSDAEIAHLGETTIPGRTMALGSGAGIPSHFPRMDGSSGFGSEWAPFQNRLELDENPISSTTGHPRHRRRAGRRPAGKMKPGASTPAPQDAAVANITPFAALACPLDGAPLQRNAAAWCCAAGHSFDIASQGYIHLLPVQNKRSRDPGDSKEMVAARRRFLDAGHYQPIAAAAGSAVLAGLPPGATAACLDAGCGEGYYLRQLAAAACAEGRSLAILGLDISKWAVLAAAKQDKRPNWVVGSNANLPVLAGTLDRVLCMFGFPVYPEFARVLKPDGRLIQVDAGPDHLRELREIIYPALKPERSAGVHVPEGFTRLSDETVRFPLDLAGAGPIADLLAMTPHLYRASAEGRTKAAALTALTVTVEVGLTTFRRDAGH
jgi:23S rRNA (guanine745-N1)-methyltransferase